MSYESVLRLTVENLNGIIIGMSTEYTPTLPEIFPLTQMSRHLDCFSNIDLDLSLVTSYLSQHDVSDEVISKHTISLESVEPDEINMERMVGGSYDYDNSCVSIYPQTIVISNILTEYIEAGKSADDQSPIPDMDERLEVILNETLAHELKHVADLNNPVLYAQFEEYAAATNGLLMAQYRRGRNKLIGVGALAASSTGVMAWLEAWTAPIPLAVGLASIQLLVRRNDAAYLSILADRYTTNPLELSAHDAHDTPPKFFSVSMTDDCKKIMGEGLKKSLQSRTGNHNKM